MTHTVTVALPPSEILARAKRFFAERVPHASAFVEKEGPEFVVLRGQGGEELVLNARLLAKGEGSEQGEGVGGGRDGGERSRVRASTLYFDQAVDRFFSTLPLESGVEVA
jgi:hypothetical protein